MQIPYNKKIIFTILLCCCALAGKAQTDSTIAAEKQLKSLQSIDNKLLFLSPRYKIYPTDNVHISIKLDTATGGVWMVQIALGDSDGMEVPINDRSLANEEVFGLNAGRFELYPTKNIYNFILLDTQIGYTYQVQWSTEADKRFISRLY